MSWRRGIAVLLLLAASGCESISFYSQAIEGHLSVMASARPIDAWLADPATTPALRARLEAARRIRQYASRELGLPDNGSYLSYADLGRPFVVWNLFAAREFSVEPKKECFPITGCVSYRGFFSEQDARQHAAQLREGGYDVHVGGVPAYSTLGWFDDPLLSSFILYPDAQLARLIFHELAHQLVYAGGDTAFNESFAVVVEEEGVRRWLEAEGRPAELAAFRAAQARKREFAARVEQTRVRLKSIYSGSLSREEMLEQKRGEFARLRQDYGAIVPQEPNNAFLVSISLYTQLVPQFERLLAESGSLEKFYLRARELAATKAEYRRFSGTPGARTADRTRPAG
ncbi:MAG TPA: aminopeptidase [Burkholderiales bacterium]|nr:aminopeptidase [Burkholderiales bacterium]